MSLASISSNVLSTVDGLIRSHRLDDRGKHVLAYPRVDGDLSNYEYYDLARIDETVDRVSLCLLQHGASQQATPFENTATIIAPSGIELLMSACALSRLGYTVLILSPRLAATASSALMRQVESHLVLIAEQFWESCQVICETMSATCYVCKLPKRSSWPSSSDKDLIDKGRYPDSDQFLNKTAFILHSSGSTGLLKPIFTSHRRYIENAKNSFAYSALVTLPLFHAYGFASFFRAVAGRTLLVLPDSTLPLTAENVVETLELTRPQVLSAVPFTLKLLSDIPKAWPLLRDLELVTFHGSACPDEVGDLLVKQGINLVAHLGSTEAGALATSTRPKGDTSWNYLRFLPSVKPFVKMKHVTEDIFELLLLDGLKTKVLSNSDDPPNSLHTRDLFREHSTIPDAWYYLGRQDDRITLANGEKVLPLPIESHVMESPLVRQALVFGVGKDFPGMLVFRSRKAAAMSDAVFFDNVWPWIARANSMAESFSQVTRSMVVPLSAETTFPQTDKGSVIRAQTYLLFHQEIQDAYTQVIKVTGTKPRYGPVEMREFLLKLCREELDMPDVGIASNLFRYGLDSLKATQLLSHLRRVELDEHSQNIKLQQIYSAGSLDALADVLCEPLRFVSTEEKLVENLSHKHSIRAVIEQYGTFEKKLTLRRQPDPAKKVLLLTGATGSLGSHILAQALLDGSYQHVFCLVRLESSQDPTQRLLSQLRKQRLEQTITSTGKFTVLPADLSQSSLGLDDHMYEFLRQRVTHIIHAAWSVNFTHPLSVFVSTHIAGTRNLLDMSLSTEHRSNFALCSSIAVGSRWSSGDLVPETLITDFTHTSDTGYAQSKLVAENIVARARDAGANATVLRIGQVIGSLRAGIWNDRESVPLMVRSALTMTKPCMPAIPGSVSWIPVDICAAAVLELCDCASVSEVYNISNPSRTHWTGDFLPALKDAGVSFAVVSPSTWIASLRSYAEDLGVSAAIQCPAVKLLDFWTRRYDNDDDLKCEVTFDTAAAQDHSVTLREFTKIQDVNDMMKQGYVQRFVKMWHTDWGL